MWMAVPAIPAVADDSTNVSKAYAAWTEAEFHRTQTLFLADTNNATNAWQFAKASFDWAEIATKESQRAEISKQGIAASKALVARDPKSAPGHYYLAMNYGELAEAEAPSLAAYHLIKEIEREFKTAAGLDEQFDHAGPARNLGMLYRDAPGWPLSIGSKRKARENMERAVALDPGYPENQLNLAESCLHWRDIDAAVKELNALDARWSNAQKQLTGPAWEKSWRDWADRREALRNKLNEAAPSTSSGKEK